MRPGMPLGRKHFRRSRDAPIYYGKDCGQSCCQRSLSLKTCFYHSRWRRSVKTLDDGDAVSDSEGEIAAIESKFLARLYTNVGPGQEWTAILAKMNSFQELYACASK